MKTISKYKQAQALGVSPQVVYTWYNGSILPRADRLIQLAEMLEITPRELLDIFQQRVIPVTTTTYIRQDQSAGSTYSGKFANPEN